MKKKLIGIFVILIGLILTSCDFEVSNESLFIKEYEAKYDGSSFCLALFLLGNEEKPYENMESFEYYESIASDEIYESEFVIEITTKDETWYVRPIYNTQIRFFNGRWLSVINDELSKGTTENLLKWEPPYIDDKDFRTWWESKYKYEYKFTFVSYEDFIKDYCN